MIARGWLMIAALSGFLAVSLGAFGAHMLKTLFSDYQMQIYQTGVSYQFYHTLALLLVVLLSQQYQARALRVARVSFLVGMVLFSGSLYLLAYTGIGWLGAITPLGGSLLLVGWLSLAWAGYNAVQRT